MGPGPGQTRDPWICRQTRIFSQMRYQLCYAVLLQKISRDYLGRGMRFPTMWFVRPAKPQISLHSLIRASSSRSKNYMSVELLSEYHLEFLSLKRGCTGSSEPIHIKIPHCWNLMSWLNICTVSSQPLLPPHLTINQSSLTCLFILFHL